MPRLSRQLIRRARKISPLASLILQETRELSSASTELRWIREHVAAQRLSEYHQREMLIKLCKDRSKGRPLQYILGNQPFGDIEIICRPGVLCPRPETEEAVYTLAGLLKKHCKQHTKESPLRILDLCTGPGSIALLLSLLLQDKISHQIVGVDISRQALSVAQQSFKHNVENGFMTHKAPIRFIYGDVLHPDATLMTNIYKAFKSLDSNINSTGTQMDNLRQEVDLVISNPPYISPQAIWQDTGRSVRRYEPRLALVPLWNQTGYQKIDSIAQEDVFYPRISQIAQYLNAKAVVVESSGSQQAKRVENMYKNHDRMETATWQDFAGHERMVVAWNKSTNSYHDWQWLQKL